MNTQKIVRWRKNSLEYPNSLLMELLEGAQPRSAILPGLQKLGIELPWNNFVCCCVLTDCANQDFLKNIAKEVKNNRTVTADRLKIKYEVISGFRGLSGTERSGQGFQTGWQGQGEDTGLLYVKIPPSH